MFGNVGWRDRLTFSAFGAAVNEVQRLQELTKKYRHSVIASEAFVGYAGGSWTTLGQEKLRGVEDAITVLSPDLSKQRCSRKRARSSRPMAGFRRRERDAAASRRARPRAKAALKKMLQ